MIVGDVLYYIKADTLIELIKVQEVINDDQKPDLYLTAEGENATYYFTTKEIEGRLFHVGKL